MRRKTFILLLTYAAVTGNCILIGLILYKEGAKIPTMGLMGLLAITSLQLLYSPKEIMLQSLLRYTVITCNIFFILFILFNGINEGFKAPLPEKIYYFSVIALLAINSILLSLKKKAIISY